MSMAQNVTALAQRVGEEVKAVKGLAVAAAPMIGEVRLLAFSVPPPGWIVCDGAAYAGSAWPALYAKIGTTYGGDSGSFNVPDLRNRVPMQAGTGQITEVALGQIGGMGNRILQGLTKFVLGVNNLPAHSHTTTAKIKVNSTSSGSPLAENNFLGRAAGTAGSIYNTVSTPNAYMNPDAVEVANGSAGGGEEVNATTTTEAAAIVPPFVGMNYVIYAGQ